MTEAKKGRPALPDDQKRQQIGVRTSPALKLALEAAAAENGRSVAQEAEWRLQQSFDDQRRAGGEHTDQLLRAMAGEIEQIEAETRKRWNKDLVTWAAVDRLFQNGPIKRLRPDLTSDDEVVMEAWKRIYAAEQEKKEICALLSLHQIYVMPGLPEKPKSARRGGIFGASAAPQPNRDKERKAVDALVEDAAERAEAMNLIDRLEALDESHRKADADWSEALRPYHEAEAKGRDIFRQMMQRRAQELFARGDYSLMGEAF